MLKSINRPAILEIQRELGSSNWVVLRAINDDGSLVVMDNRELLEIPYVDIAQYWTGRFITLLSQPNVQIKMSPGFKGEQVKWLRQRIAISKGDNKSYSKSTVYDLELSNEVKVFQSKYQLDIDGLVGNDTLLYLYNVVAPKGTPILLGDK